MNIFNTKKLREEYERRIKDSYNQGKIDAIDDAKLEADKSKERKKEWEELSEKKLMSEIMYSISINNEKINHLDKKINNILSYNELFNQVNLKFKELEESEKRVKENTKQSEKQIKEYSKKIEEINKKINEIEKSTSKAIELKEKINSLIEHLKNTIPAIIKSCEQIDEIAFNMESIINKYSDSPVDTINNIHDLTQDIKEELEYGNNIITMGSDINSISSDVDNISNSLNILMNKISDLESRIFSIEYRDD